MTHNETKLCINCTHRLTDDYGCGHPLIGTNTNPVHGGITANKPCAHVRKEGAECGLNGVLYTPIEKLAISQTQGIDCITDHCRNQKLAEQLGMALGKAFSETLVNFLNSNINHTTNGSDTDPIQI